MFQTKSTEMHDLKFIYKTNIIYYLINIPCCPKFSFHIQNEHTNPYLKILSSDSLKISNKYWFKEFPLPTASRSKSRISYILENPAKFPRTQWVHVYEINVFEQEKEIWNETNEDCGKWHELCNRSRGETSLAMIRCNRLPRSHSMSSPLLHCCYLPSLFLKSVESRQLCWDRSLQIKDYVST